MRWNLTALVICLLCSSITTDANDWPMYQHDLQHTGYSPSRMPQLKEKWVDEKRASHLALVVASGDRVYAVRKDSLSVLDIHTGSELRNVEIVGFSWTFPAIENNKIYMTSLFSIFCLDGNTGEENWRHTVMSVNFTSFPIIVDNHLITGGGDAITDSIKITDKEKSLQDMRKISDNASRVLCLDKGAGEIMWEFFGNDWMIFSPAYLDGRVYINDGGRHVYCLNEKTGEPIWKKHIEWTNSSSLSLDRERIYVGTYHGLVCLDLKTGEILWRFECTGTVTQCPALGYGRVFFGSVDGMFYCLDAETGKEIWKMETGDPISAPAIVADKKVAFGTNRGTLYIVKAKSGEIVESVNLGGSEITSLALSDGKLLVGQENGKITCFEGVRNEVKEVLILPVILAAILFAALSLLKLWKRKKPHEN